MFGFFPHILQNCAFFCIFADIFKHPRQLGDTNARELFFTSSFLAIGHLQTMAVFASGACTGALRAIGNS
jgi:hypothetical protein